MLTKFKLAQLLLMLVVLIALFFWRSLEEPSQQAASPQSETHDHAHHQHDDEYDDGEQEQLIEPAVSLVRCDYQTPCEFISEQGEYTLSVDNLPIQAEQLIPFSLRTPNEGVQVLSAQIVGKTMFMGKVPVNFHAEDAQTFTTQTLVGACMHDQMVWTLQIEVDNAGQQTQLAFDFLIEH